MSAKERRQQGELGHFLAASWLCSGPRLAPLPSSRPGEVRPLSKRTLTPHCPSSVKAICTATESLPSPTERDPVSAAGVCPLQRQRPESRFLATRTAVPFQHQRPSKMLPPPPPEAALPGARTGSEGEGKRRAGPPHQRPWQRCRGWGLTSPQVPAWAPQWSPRSHCFMLTRLSTKINFLSYSTNVPVHSGGWQRT